MLAVAHHHQTRAVNVPRYQLIPNWKKYAEKAIQHAAKVVDDFPLLGAGHIQHSEEFQRKLPESMPPFSDAGAYHTYAVISRILRLADRNATEKYAKMT